MHAISRDHMKQPPLKRLLVYPNYENIALSKMWDNSSTPNTYNRCFLSSREIHDALQYQVDVEDQPVLVFLGTHRRTNLLFLPQNVPHITFTHNRVVVSLSRRYSSTVSAAVLYTKTRISAVHFWSVERLDLPRPSSFCRKY